MLSSEILRTNIFTQPRTEILPKGILRETTPLAAKPAIPIEEPRKKDVPDIPDPMRRPIPEPAPAEPVKTPGILVPA